MSPVRIENSVRHGEQLVDLLVDEGPLSSADVCERLGWSKGRFDTALKAARDEVCPPIGIVIPHPVPSDGWRYQVTTEWGPVEEGAAYSLGMVEARLKNIFRDVTFIKPHLEKGTVAWRRANFLEKHLGHIIGTLKEINGG